MITVCPRCANHLQNFDRKKIGEKVQCPNCKEHFIVRAAISCSKCGFIAHPAKLFCPQCGNQFKKTSEFEGRRNLSPELFPPIKEGGGCGAVDLHHVSNGSRISHIPFSSSKPLEDTRKIHTNVLRVGGCRFIIRDDTRNHPTDGKPKNKVIPGSMKSQGKKFVEGSPMAAGCGCALVILVISILCFAGSFANQSAEQFRFSIYMFLFAFLIGYIVSWVGCLSNALNRNNIAEILILIFVPVVGIFLCGKGDSLNNKKNCNENDHPK